MSNHLSAEQLQKAFDSHCAPFINQHRLRLVLLVPDEICQYEQGELGAQSVMSRAFDYRITVALGENYVPFKRQELTLAQRFWVDQAYQMQNTFEQHCLPFIAEHRALLADLVPSYLEAYVEGSVTVQDLLNEAVMVLYFREHPETVAETC